MLPASRLSLLKGAGWEPFELEQKRYLMPDAELAQFALGTAYGDYRAVVEGRGGSVAAPSPYAGAYGDLIDAILYNECLDGRTTFESGATLLYPRAFDNISPSASILRRVGIALKSGWAMVNPITEGRDMFLLPPEAIVAGKKVTPDDTRISRGVLKKLHELGLTGLRGRGLGNARIAPAVFALPDRAARGQTWESLLTDQTARWGGAHVTPVVDFANYPVLDELPELGRFLKKHHPYVERFDLMRIEFYVSAWRRTADFDALEHMIGGIKGVMGEIAARREIVAEYRRERGSNSILLFAPQIMSGKDVLERSDAMVVQIEDGGMRAVIERVWEVVTAEDERAIAHAQEQHRASVGAYQKGGIIFRDADGRVFTCDKAVLPEGNVEGYTEVVCGRDAEMDQVLDALRDRMVAMMEMDLIGTRVRKRFSPTVEELQEILREPQAVERLMELLGALAPVEGRLYVTGMEYGDHQVTGFRIVDEKEVGKVSKQYFLLGFDVEDGKYVLREAKHKGALKLALLWVESRLGRGLDSVEKAFLAGVLGTKTYSGDADERVTVEALAGHLREHGIARLIEIMRAVGASIPKECIYVTGRVVNDRKVVGIRIVDKKKAENLGHESFRLGFDPEDGGYALREAKGGGVLDIALPWVESRLSRRLDLVEKSFLAGILGIVMQSGDAEGRITVEGLAGYLRSYRIERLLELMRVVGVRVPDSRLYVVGQVRSNSRVGGLRIVDEGEAGTLGKSFFLLGFDPVEGGYALRAAKHTGALELALPWVETRLGRKLDSVEKSFLAGVLGTQTHSYDAEDRVTVEALTGYLNEHGIAHLLDLISGVGASIPKGRSYITGQVKDGHRVSGLQIVDEEESVKLGKHYFLLGFDPKDGAYHLDRTNMRAAPSLKKALLL